MSEYQYYEFRAVDRPLDDREMAELRRHSTRADITPTSFVNDYSWGSFKGDINGWMERYFDAFVYLANWGTRELIFRLPRGAVDLDAMATYAVDEGLEIRPGKDFAMVSFRSEDEWGDGWIDAEGLLDDLIGLRDELLRGDLRPLYLGWLATIAPPHRQRHDDWGYGDADESEDDDIDEQDDGLDPDRLEPALPPGLKRLTRPQKALVEFLRIDPDLVAAAATESGAASELLPNPDDLADWLADLPADEKDEILLRLMTGDREQRLGAELLRRHRKDAGAGSPLESDSDPAGRRTVAALRQAAAEARQARLRADAEAKAREEARRAAEAAEARERHLKALARREADAWAEVDTLIATKRPKAYDQAAALIADLLELAARAGRSDRAAALVRDLRARHTSKPAMLRRIDALRVGV